MSSDNPEVVRKWVRDYEPLISPTKYPCPLCFSRDLMMISLHTNPGVSYQVRCKGCVYNVSSLEGCSTKEYARAYWDANFTPIQRRRRKNLRELKKEKLKERGRVHYGCSNRLA